MSNLVSAAPPFTTLLYKTTSSPPSNVPPSLLKQVSKKFILPQVLRAGGSEADADAYVDLLFSEGSLPPLGTITSVEMDQSGVSVTVAGRPRGRVASPALGRALVNMYLDSDSPLPDLREAVFRRLQAGSGWCKQHDDPHDIKPSRHSPEKADFPPVIGQRAFAASLDFRVPILGPDIHPADVGLYLDKGSDLWGKTYCSVDELLEKAWDKVTIVMLATLSPPEGVSPPMLEMVSRSLLDAQLLKAGGTKTDVDAYQALLWKEGALSAGESTQTQLDSMGVSVIVKGKSEGRVNSPALAKAILTMYLGHQSQMPQLVELFRNRLKTVPPAAASAADRRTTTAAQESSVALSQFPPASLGHRFLVASLQKRVDIGSREIHPYDVALYLDGSSPLWGRRNRIEDLINHAPEHTTIQYKSTSDPPAETIPLEEMKRLAKERILPRVLAVGGSEVDAESFVALQFDRGGSVPRGTISTFDFDRDGVSVSIGGSQMGRVNSPALARALVPMYLDVESHFPDLRDTYARNLERRIPPDI
eukprot:gnl/TRDRNA2_/TRDRNA2_140290_c1_seq1.p1 gnl/TRDRNA2_/TRDRNA2_140290_c1~~gnl/TRDRNA2_/TRDRNA2_140290_c1_seq1.p1  ORF type:complete len:611 (-),score=81.18 gnl/TRDRNA2_/TRDRNA2_140290_c1_seq1:109-1707(-)